MTTDTIAPPRKRTEIKDGITEEPISLVQLAHELGVKFAERAADHDMAGDFVIENYEDLKRHRLMSAMIPTELGGMGMSHSQVGEMLRVIAHYCGSTSLAFAMHQHLISASVWKYKHQGVGAKSLRKIADQQLVLISTGARDWLESNGEMEKTDGGYIVSATKHFASQSVYGDIAVTSAPFQNEDGEWKVLHFPVSMKAEGVSVLDDWDVMGMRSTGSQSIRFERVFVPEASIALERTRGVFHPVWNLVLSVAMPLISATYVGLAERAFEIACNKGKAYQRNLPHMKYIMGKLHNALISARVQGQEMFRIANDLDFELSHDNSVQVLSLKTNVADQSMETVKLAMEALGGQSFYKHVELERIFRDVQASQFHPLPKWEQYFFTGEKLMA